MTGVERHTVVWLVRHGQTTWNRERRYLSRTDQPLTEYGLQRARALGQTLRRFTISAVLTSGLGRTQETAAAILAQQARPPQIGADVRWAEGDHGRWEGLTYAEISRTFAAEAQARFSDPWRNAPQGGETLTSVQERTRAAWHDLVRNQSGGRVLVVGHATPFQLLLCDLLGCAAARYWQFRLDLGSLTWLDLYASAAIVRTINYLPPYQP